jgi:hypothetical protein
MTAMSGKDGAVTFATGYATKVRSWTIDAGSEEVDITALGDGWKRFIAGVKNWSGTYTAVMVDSALVTGTGTTNNLGLGTSAAAAPFTFGTDSINGDIIITGVSGNLATEAGAGEFTFTFVGDNEMNVTAA